MSEGGCTGAVRAEGSVMDRSSVTVTRQAMKNGCSNQPDALRQDEPWRGNMESCVAHRIVFADKNVNEPSRTSGTMY